MVSILINVSKFKCKILIQWFGWNIYSFQMYIWSINNNKKKEVRWLKFLKKRLIGIENNCKVYYEVYKSMIDAGY